MYKRHLPAHHMRSAHGDEMDFTPYYYLNATLTFFWLTYLGVAATFVVVSLFFAPTIDDTMWVPIFFYSLSTAYVIFTIGSTIMAKSLRVCDPDRALEIIKLPLFIAAAVLLLRFLIPLLDYLQSLFIM